MKRISLCILVSVLTHAQLSLANNSIGSKSTVQQTIVVTGTRTEKNIEDSPIPVTVITRETIDEQGSSQLNELLKTIPGITLVDQHGQQGQSIMMQGMDSEHVLVLVNGIPVSQTSGAINTERLSLNNVNQIEVVPGSSSALYGSSAMGGVINIITKNHSVSYINGLVSVMQTESDLSMLPTQTSAQLQTGLNMGTAYWDNALAVTQYSGVDTNPQTYDHDVASGLRWNVTEKIAVQDSEFIFDWSGGRLQRPYTDTKANNVFKYIKFENSDELDAQLIRKKESYDQSAQLSFDSYETIQDLTTSESDFTRTAQSGSLRLAHNGTVNWTAHSITSGLLAHWHSLQQASTTQPKEVTPVTQLNLEGYVQDDWTLSTDLNVVLGARVQWNEGFNSFLSPKIAVRWNAITTDRSSVFMRASTGLGYRTPSLKELHYEFDHSHLGYMVFGNPDLEPEQSVSTQVEIGGNIKLGYETIVWSFNGYRQNVSNLLSYEIDSSLVNGLDNYAYQNTDSALIEGMDASLTVPIDLSFASIASTTHIQVLRAIDEQTDTTLDRRPSVQWDQSFRFVTALPFEPVFNLQLSHTGEQTINSEKQSAYQQLGVSSLWTLTPSVSLQLGVSNLTDHYKSEDNTSLALPTMGRTWRVQFTYK